jgi:protein SCO1/2
VTKAFSIHVERNGVLLDHTLATAIVDGNGRIAEIWRGNGWTMTELLEVLRRESAAAPDHAADRH